MKAPKTLEGVEKADRGWRRDLRARWYSHQGNAAPRGHGATFFDALLVRGTRAVLVISGACWLAGCSFLPLTVQSRNVAAHLGLPREEIAAVVRQASAAHRLDAQWIKKATDASVEVGLGRGATTLSVVYYRFDGRWTEAPGTRRTWPPSSDLPTPPVSASY